MTTKDDLFVPELVADSVMGFVAAGVPALLGTGAGRIVPGMPNGKHRVGETVKIPYFGSIGEFEDLVNDGDALTPAAFAQTNESATVIHSGRAFELTKWAQGASDDPYGEVARQVIDGMRRRLDKAMLDAAVSSTGWSSYTHDVLSTSTKMSYDVFVNAMLKLGDEANPGEFAALVVHPSVLKDMYLEKDDAGNPLLFKNAWESPAGFGKLPTYLGVPVFASERMPVSGGTDYTSVLLKRDSLIVWMSDISDSDIGTDKDILTNADVGALHIYFAAHRFLRMPGRAKPGVVRILTKAS